MRPAPSGTDSATAGSSSEPGGQLERAAADVEEQDLAGRPAEPAPHREEREARLRLAAEHLQRLARAPPRCARSRRRRSSPRARRMSRWRAVRRPARIAATRRASATAASRRETPSSVIAPSGVEVAHQPQHGALARRSPAGARPAAHRPRADGRCWSRCRGLRGARGDTYRAAPGPVASGPIR